MSDTEKKKRRRPRGSGSIYRRGRTLWISYIGPDGLRHEESSGSERNGDAERMLRNRVGAREHNLPVIPKVEQLTFAEAASAWLDAFALQRRNKSLNVVTRRTKKHLLPYFAARRLASITRDDVVAYTKYRLEQGIVDRKGTRRADVSSSEINRELQCLKRIFNYMAEGGRIGLVPHIPMNDEPPPRAGFFDEEQLVAVLGHLPSEIQPVIRFAAITGWRIASEVLPLEWRQIDFAAGEIRLDPGRTKNGDARVFPFTSELRRLLQTRQAEREQLRKAGHVVPWVFWRMVADERGGEKKPRRIRAFTTAWKRACRAAGCPGRVPHDLRRTAVRSLVQAGVPQTVAMKLTGHKTDSVFRRYAIVSPNDLSDAVRRLDAASL